MYKFLEWFLLYSCPEPPNIPQTIFRHGFWSQDKPFPKSCDVTTLCEREEIFLQFCICQSLLLKEYFTQEYFTYYCRDSLGFKWQKSSSYIILLTYKQLSCHVSFIISWSCLGVLFFLNERLLELDFHVKYKIACFTSSAILLWVTEAMSRLPSNAEQSDLQLHGVKCLLLVRT